MLIGFYAQILIKKKHFLEIYRSLETKLTLVTYKKIFWGCSLNRTAQQKLPVDHVLINSKHHLKSLEKTQAFLKEKYREIRPKRTSVVENIGLTPGTDYLSCETP